MTGEGVVVKTRGSRATVRIEKKSACSGDCSSCGMCNNPVYDVEAENTAGASAGDKVRLYMPTAKVYAAAFLVYMFPVLVVFAVMGICSILNVHSGITASVCALALAVWIFVILRYNRRADLKSEIIEIVTKIDTDKL